MKAGLLSFALLASLSLSLDTQVETRVEAGWISRDPALAAPTRIDAPITEGWPEAGRAIHWVAHVFNRGSAPVDISYRWRMDGALLDSGIRQLPPGETQVSWPWRWEFVRHEITFDIATIDATDDNADDNAVTILSDALSVALFVERSTYDWMLEGGRPGFERLAQREVTSWNRILERAVFPTTPDGVRDRVRLDNVVVFADGDRPRTTEYLYSDLEWTYLNIIDDTRFLHKGSSAAVQANQTVVFHELLHERGLVDLYAYDVWQNFGTPENGGVNIVDNGKPVVGSILMPYLGQAPNRWTVYHSFLDGLMGTIYQPTANLTEHCLNGLNLWAGRRTPLLVDRFGNLINKLSNGAGEPSYVRLLPQKTAITLVDENGNRLAGATVSVYADHNPFSYVKTYAAQPDRTFAADGSGVFTLPGDIFDGLPPATAPRKSQTLIIGVYTSLGRGFAFIPGYDLNLLYFRTGPERGAMTLPVKLH